MKKKGFSSLSGRNPEKEQRKMKLEGVKEQLVVIQGALLSFNDNLPF